ncbi:Fructose-bisphosphate aldolase 1 [Sesbania bispinosa]|nr:Fructose-bisphosphate aldolase 1 [Sesbania bispinosa]
MASASATLLKSSPVLDKSEWVKGQSLRQPSASVVDAIPPPHQPSPSSWFLC